jgi:YihY family inner membrane protein
MGTTMSTEDASSNDPGRSLPWTQRGVVQRARDSAAPVDFVFSGIDGFIRHKTGRHAALLAHYGFLSVFPLLAVMTTILGFVLENASGLRTRIVDSAFSNLPFIGEQIQQDPSQIHGNALVLIAGLATAFWAGTKCFVAAQNGMNDIWEVPERDRPSLARSRGRALIAIGVVGLAQVASATVTGIVAISGVSWLNRILLVIAAIAINIGVLLEAYRVLTARALNRRQLLPGAIGAGIGFSVLQLIGTTIVQRAIRSSTPVYGNFATVIALLSWLTMHAVVALLGVEANAALDRRQRRVPT